MVCSVCSRLFPWIAPGWELALLCMPRVFWWNCFRRIALEFIFISIYIFFVKLLEEFGDAHHVKGTTLDRHEENSHVGFLSCPHSSQQWCEESMGFAVHTRVSPRAHHFFVGASPTLISCVRMSLPGGGEGESKPVLRRKNLEHLHTRTSELLM